MSINHDFEKCSIGCQESATFTVHNEHNEPADILSIGVSTEVAEFSIENDHCSGQSLLPIESCTFNVFFTPQTTGMKTGDIAITIQDYYLRSLRIEISGSAEMCAGDFDGDGDVDGVDRANFLEHLEHPVCQGCY